MNNTQQPPLPTLQPGDSHMESLIAAAIQGHADTRDAMRWLVRQLVPGPQPAELTDADIEQALVLAHAYADAKLMRYGTLGVEVSPDPDAAFQELRRAILALRPVQVPMTDDQWTDVLGSSGPDLLDLAKKWADNKVHVYQVVNEAEKIVKAAVLRGIAAQAKKEGG